MRNISTFNKFFLILCAALIILLAFTVPHEEENYTKQQDEMVSTEE